MTYTRVLQGSPSLPGLLKIRTDTADFQVVAEDRNDIEVTLFTEDDEGGLGAQMIRAATGEVYGDTYELTVKGPDSHTVVSGNVGVVAGTIFGGVHMHGNRNVQVGHGNVQYNNFSSGGGSFVTRGVQGVVRVPTNTSVNIRSGAGDVETLGNLGAFAGKLSSGNARLASVAELDADLAAGDIWVGYVHDGANVDCSSGNVKLEDVGGYINLSSASGNVKVGRLTGSGRMVSTAGNVKIKQFDGQKLLLKTTMGNISHPEHPGITAKTTMGDINGRSGSRW